MAKLKRVLYQQNTQIIKLQGLRDGETGVFISVATVSATLKARDGSTVSQINNLALSYVPGSNGDYEGTVDATFNPPKGGGYILTVESVDGSVKLHEEVSIQVKVRNV
jgi:hypothetical protein